MDDLHSQFVIAVGDLCTAAALAALEVEVVTRDGERTRGLPSAVPTASEADQVDESGYARTFKVDGRFLGLDEIVQCMIRLPDAPDH